MSTNSDYRRTDDELARLLSAWQTGSIGNDELRRSVGELDTAELAPGQRAAVQALERALVDAYPGERETLSAAVRETVEALAFGD